MTPELAALVDEAEGMARRVAPCVLADRPFYVVPRSLLPLKPGREWQAAGWAGSTVDAELRGVIGGRWKGRGPAVVVSDADLWPDNPAVRRAAFLTTAVHELGHVADRGGEVGDLADPTPEGARKAAADTLAAMTDPARWGATYTPGAQAAGHLPAWLRVTLHLAHRALLAGYPVLPVGLWGYDWLPDAHDCFRALGTEPDEFEGQPLSAVLTLPPHPELNRLWLAGLATLTPQEVPA